MQSASRACLELCECEGISSEWPGSLLSVFVEIFNPLLDILDMMKAFVLVEVHLAGGRPEAGGSREWSKTAQSLNEAQS